MARWYDTTFRDGAGKTVTIRSSGNTQRSSERTSRGKLHRDLKLDAKAFYTVSTVHVSPATLDPERPWLRPGDKGYRGPK